MGIDWALLKRERFDEIVETYLTRKLSPTGRVIVLNGRGGDGGKDVLHVRPDGTSTIYQLKFFPEGFPSNMKGRRQQIKRSFKAAMQDSPDEWVIVVPEKLTGSEHRFLENLPSSLDETAEVTIDYLDPPRLNDGLSLFPDLVEYFMRDSVTAVAKLWGREQAALTGGMTDLQARVAGLGRLTSSVDPYWDIDFSRVGNITVQTVRAKIPEAPEISPITISLSTDLSAEEPELQRKLKRSFDYGTAERIILPPSAVTSLDISGPDWLAGSESNVEVQWWPAPSTARGKPVEVRVHSESGTVLSAYRGVVAHLGVGAAGHNLVADMCNGSMHFDLLLPHELGGNGALDFRLSESQPLPGDLRRALQLRRDILTSPSLELLIDDQRVGLIRFGDRPEETAEESDEWEDLADIAADLDALQRHCGQEFPLPTSLTGMDRAILRAFRLIVEGKLVALPFGQRLTANLTITNQGSLREAARNPSQLLIEQPEFKIEILGRVLLIGHVRLHSPYVTCANSDEVIAALDSQASEIEVIYEPRPKRHFLAFMPSRYSGDGRTVTPWKLRGIPEPPDVGDSLGSDDAAPPRA